MLLEQGIYYSPDGGGGGAVGKDAPGIQDETILIGKSQYLLSKEMQLECFLTRASSYESTTSILTIGEPHSNAEAQFSLFRGLEIFFGDNPELAEKTIFLTEGFPANEPISVQHLIEADPHPDDELIRQTLHSFLITGYMAYEWKHQQNIPIVGTENQALYEMSREFATWCVEDPNALFAEVFKKTTETTGRRFRIPVSAAWTFAINVRNKSIATTLIDKAHSYENPILFVGSGHLHTKQDESSFNLLKELVEMGPDGPFGAYVSALTECENHSIHYYLQQEKIGYTALEPFGFDRKREEMTYQRLFEAQRKGKTTDNVDYEGYMNWLLTQKKPKSRRATTVRPSPKAAAEFVRRLKEQQEAEQKSGVVYEVRPEHDPRFDWFEISPEKLQSVLGKETIWGQGIDPQGRDFETLRMVNLGSNCPHIDDIVVDAMTVTQHKSMDLRLKSYQDVGGIGSTVSGYIDHLDERTKGKWSWHDKKNHKDYDFERGRNFQDRYLELGIPAGRATQAQIEELLELQDYAQTKDVTLVIVEVP